MFAYTAAAVLTDIAVVAQDLEMSWETPIDDPLVKGVGVSELWLLFPVLPAVIVDMINGEHGRLRFSATVANISAIFGVYSVP